MSNRTQVMAYFQGNIKINLYSVYQRISNIHESQLIKKKKARITRKGNVGVFLWYW